MKTPAFFFSSIAVLVIFAPTLLRRPQAALDSLAFFNALLVDLVVIKLDLE